MAGMRSTQPTIEGAILDFRFMRNHAPYRFGGKWFVAKTAEGFETYRTRKAAAAHSTLPQLWLLDFTSQEHSR